MGACEVEASSSLSRYLEGCACGGRILLEQSPLTNRGPLLRLILAKHERNPAPHYIPFRSGLVLCCSFLARASRPAGTDGFCHFSILLLIRELEAAKPQLALRGSFTTKEAKGSLTVGQLWETQGKSSSRCYGYGPFIMHPRE